MPRNPVVRYSIYIRDLLKDDVARLELGDVVEAFHSSRHLRKCAEKILKKMLRVDSIVFEPRITRDSIRAIARKIRTTSKKKRVLVFSLTPYRKTRTFIGPAEDYYALIVLDKAVVIITVTRVDPEWCRTMYIINDKYEVIQA